MRVRVRVARAIRRAARVPRDIFMTSSPEWEGDSEADGVERLCSLVPA